MKGFSPLIGALLILAIAAGALFVSGAVKFQAQYGLEEGVFCNLYEFQCCTLQDSGTAQATISNGIFSGNQKFTCQSDRCVITNKISASPFQSNGDYAYINGIRQLFITPITLNTNDTIGADGASSVIFQYTFQNRQLFWTGSATSTIGIPVAGSDRCSFITDKAIYDKNGNLIASPTNSQISYTVPVNTCYQIVRNERFLCGTKFNECTQNTQCTAGHTYTYRDSNGDLLGAEASVGSLQIYGCVQTGQVPSPDQTSILPGESQSSTQFNYGNKCQVIRTQPVQCIPGSSTCGANAVCDVSTFTCKQTGQVQCTQDRDCGIGETYDQNTKTYYNFACVANQCQRRATRTVQCAYNSECPQNWYCDIGGTCKELTQPKQSCPSACCVGDPRYFDRPAPAGNVCCPGGQSFAPTLNQCQAQDCGFLGLGCLFGGLGSLFAGVFGAIILALFIILAIVVMVVIYKAYRWARG